MQQQTASGHKPGNQGNELVFVNLSDPTTSPNDIKKLVRSSATSHSHRDPTRKQITKRSASRKIALAYRVITSTRIAGHSALDSYNTESSGSSASPDIAKSSRQDLRDTLPGPGNTAQIYLNGGAGDPFRAYPVPSEPWFGWVLDYYRHIQLPPGMAVVQHSHVEGREYINWHLRESMSEPCLFYMQLLNACTPLVVQGRVSRQTVIWLRCMLVSTLNKAVSNAKTATATPVLLAVSSIAIHERLYGDRVLALDVHGRAFRTILAMRGGLEALPVPRICLRLLLWTEDLLDARNSDKSTTDLLTAWAPDELRSQHPGYGAGIYDEDLRA